MRYQLSIIQYPSGRFGFVGSVPKDMCVRHADHTPLSDEEFTAYKQAQNPGMHAKNRGYWEPVFETREQAIAFALKSGSEVADDSRK